MRAVRKNKTISQPKQKRKIINSYGYDVTNFGILDMSSLRNISSFKHSTKNHNINPKNTVKNQVFFK